ncbi:MAG: uroporphyrinogen decarboxylase family protein [Coriobacteriia bacterium]|nr:uroporphyrinogen decarboxylase family protein [Coriobacteriia bacterium]
MERLSLKGTPFPFGLSFIPTAALAPVARTTSDAAVALVEACISLDASFAFVPADAPWADAAMEAFAEADLAPLWAMSGPLWQVIESRGAMDGLRATLTHPEEIGGELDAGLDALVREAARGVRLGARAVVLAEDLAGTSGPLVAPDFAIAELLPRYERIVRTAHALGVPAIFHSDGDIRPLLPAIGRAGFVAVHAGGGLGLDGLERLFWAAREEGIAMVGGLLTSELGNAARAEALGSSIGILAHTGGLLVADDGGITTAEEVANLLTALAAARDT